MSRQGERMRVLISNLLDLSQIELGRLDVITQPVRLSSAIRDSLAAAPEPEGFTVSTDMDTEIRVVADPARLEQVVVNLITNAYRYARTHLDVSASREGDTVTLVFADDGPGIPESLLPNLFLPFARAANVARVPGSGLGLAIVRRLLLAFGGNVRYERNEPEGARFIVTLRGAQDIRDR